MKNSPVNQSDAVTSGNSFTKEIVKVLVLAILVVLPIRILIAQPFIVSGASMDPTFTNGDYLIVDQLSYRLEEPQRLDVVIFRYPKEPRKFFIKRIIGLPGETVTLKSGSVTINSPDLGEFDIDEEYVVFDRRDTLSTDLGDEEYFVMGDNRSASLDSRTWGALPEKNIIGKAAMRLLPLKKFEITPGTNFNVTYDTSE